MTVKKQSFAHFYDVHPLVVFWLGLLTGAIIVGLMFFYRMMDAAEYQSALLRSTRLKTTISPTSTYTVSPTYTSIGDPAGGYNYIGDPAGGYVNIGDPAGG